VEPKHFFFYISGITRLFFLQKRLEAVTLPLQHWLHFIG